MKRCLLLACALMLMAACAAPATKGARLHGDPDHPAVAQGWLRTELYFGTGLADAPATGIDETGWRNFLDAEVTPRFPEGLSVIEVYGQWRDKGAATPERLRSKLLVILHPDDAARDEAIEAIRLAWKRRTGDQSVLRVSQPATVSF